MQDEYRYTEEGQRAFAEEQYAQAELRIQRELADDGNLRRVAKRDVENAVRLAIAQRAMVMPLFEYKPVGSEIYTDRKKKGGRR